MIEIERDTQGKPVRMWLGRQSLSEFLRSPVKQRRPVWERVIETAIAAQLNLFKDKT